MNLYEQALQAYQEYEQRIRDDEAQRVMQHLLLRLLTHRFGALSEDVQERIQRADSATLERWADRSFSADSLDDVFA